MNYEEYKKAYFTNPVTELRYGFSGSFGITLYFQEYNAAVGFYEQVLGTPG